MNYISTSDNHTHHRRTPTSLVVKNFNREILSEANSFVDALFIAGDFFDRAVGVRDDSFMDILDCAKWMLDYAHKHDIIIRIMEGTPGHDCKQGRIFEKLNAIRENPVDLKYIGILEIEYIQRYNQYVLYVPDEWTRSHDDLESQIEAKLMEHGITQVDLAFLHGFFGYQIAGIPFKGFHFKEEYFLPLVKGFIHFGHVHKHSHYDRIISNGSLDRHAHGEEEPKGHVLVKDGEWYFKENTKALIYKTLKITKKETLDKLDKKIYGYPKGSYIRLDMPKDHPFNVIFPEIRSRYLDHTIEKVTKDATELNSPTYIIDEVSFQTDSFDFVGNDVSGLLFDNITKKNTLNESERSKLTDVLSVFKESTMIKEELV